MKLRKKRKKDKNNKYDLIKTLLILVMLICIIIAIIYSKFLNKPIIKLISDAEKIVSNENKIDKLKSISSSPFLGLRALHTQSQTPQLSISGINSSNISSFSSIGIFAVAITRPFTIRSS